jgi:transposase
VFIRKAKNKSGSYSIQVISKDNGKYKILKNFGSTFDLNKIELLKKEAEFFILDKKKQYSLFPTEEKEDLIIKSFLNKLEGQSIVNIGPELILGKIFNTIGLNKIKEELFKHVTLARLTYPVSKLKTTEYLLQHHNIEIDVDKIYRFLDKFHKKYKLQVEDIVYKHSKKVLGKINIVFYDMTTLYFETEDEDDLRKIGFSKDGKFQCPQIMLGLLVGEDGYPIAYDIYKGNTFEGHTIIPIIQQTQKRYNLPKPTVVADSGLLSKKNLENLHELKYKFILGARIKNETELLKKDILEKSQSLENKENFIITKPKGLRLIVSYSATRAKKDKHNRDKGLKRLNQRINSGKLTKEQINNRGYNKFLILNNEVRVSLDESKIKEDEKWDGLKGYITNHNRLTSEEVIANYNHLWKIEKAFRISKSDLRIRPVFHRKRDRIEAHICIAFCAYAVYKELERQLEINKIEISPAKAITLSKTIFQINCKLPKSQKKYSQLLKPTNIQQNIIDIFSDKNY